MSFAMKDKDKHAVSKLYDGLRDMVVSKVHGSVSGAGNSHVAKGSVKSGPTQKASENSGRNSATYLKAHKSIVKDGQDEIGADEAIAMIWELTAKSIRYGGYASRIMKAYHKCATDKSILGWLAGTARRVSSEDILATLRGHKVYRRKLDAHEVDLMDMNVLEVEDNELFYVVKGIAGDIGAFIEEWIEDNDDMLPVIFYKRKIAGLNTGVSWWKQCRVPVSSAYRRIARFKEALKAELLKIEEYGADFRTIALALPRAFNMN
jgi:hypothetical protein